MVDSADLFLAIAILGEVVVGSICAYAAYWAFSFRRALAGRIYRRHALLLGILAILFGASVFLTYSTNTIVSDIITLFSAAFFLFIFAFIDSTVPLARRSDPMLRSILSWDKLRIALWFCVGVLTVDNLLPLLSPAAANSDLGAFLENIGWFITATIVFGCSAVALVVGARRSRDPIFKGSLRWLGLLCLAAVLIFAVDTGLSALPGVTLYDFYYSYYGLPSGICAIFAAYFLYRSARALAPMSRISIVD
jgi:hypothetical protein